MNCIVGVFNKALEPFRVTGSEAIKAYEYGEYYCLRLDLSDSCDSEVLADEVFSALNRDNRPTGQVTRSLSTGDIVVISQALKALLVCRVGFRVLDASELHDLIVVNEDLMNAIRLQSANNVVGARRPTTDHRGLGPIEYVPGPLEVYQVA
jgi:hypothetical protein